MYFDEVLRVLPYWSHDRYLELAPQHWLATRALIDPAELDLPISRMTVPPATASDQATMFTSPASSGSNTPKKAT